MKLTEFRKLAYTLHTTDENNLVAMAGPVSGMKRYLRRLLNRFFSEESRDFQEQNSELKNLLQHLFDKLKGLENSIDDYNLAAYKQTLDGVRDGMQRLNELLSRMQGSVSNVENETKDEIKEKYYLKHPEEALSGDASQSSTSTPADQTIPTSGTISTETPAQNFIEPTVSPETQSLISDLEPQIISNEENSGIINPETLPHSFSAAILDQYNWTIQESETAKIQDKIKSLVRDNAAALGFDIVQAAKDSQISDWKKAPNNKMLNTFSGDVSFELTGNYLKKPVRLLGRVVLRADEGKVYIERLKPIENLKTKKSAIDFQMRKIAADLGPNFWTKFNAMGQRLGIQPEVFLPIMYIESAGFNPQVSTKGGAAGLIQFLPKMLEGVGYKDGIDGFSKLQGEDQLDYIEKFIKSIMSSFNGGKPFNSAAEYYVSNFVPDALNYRKYYEKYKGQPGWWPEGSFHDIKTGDPDAVIVEEHPTYQKSPNISLAKEAQFYHANPYLDPDKNGRITLGDLQFRIDEAKKAPAYQKILAALHSAPNYNPNVGPDIKVPESSIATSKEDSGLIKMLLGKLDIGDVPATGDFIQQIMSSIATENHNMIEVWGKDKLIAAEFVRVADLVLSRDYGFLPEIYATDNHFQMTLSKKLPIETVRHICAQIFDELNQQVRFYVRKNAMATLPEFTLEQSQRLSRMFAITRMGAS